MTDMIRSPFFATQTEAWQWLAEQGRTHNAFMTAQSLYQTRKLKRWRATWQALSNEPIWSREALIMADKSG